MNEPGVVRGIAVIRAAVESMPNAPGVYRMLDAGGAVLYVGKARDLRKRVMSYAMTERLGLRLQRMVQQTVLLEITTTRTEAEALLLEASLIKSLKPRYNILLRDDKSYPYIAITAGHDFPRIAKYRGERTKKDAHYFGPYASAGDVNRALATLQKSFLLRSCPDAVFSVRARPCLEYQIKRCSAPCVGKIGKEEYTALVKQAERVLAGKSHEVQAELTAAMEEASARMDYEKAAAIRDRIRALASIQAGQFMQVRNAGDADVVGMYGDGGHYCIHVLFFRGGSATGSQSFFPLHTDGCDDSEVMAAFLARLYQTNVPPPLLLLSHDIYGRNVLEEALETLAGRKVRIFVPRRGNRRLPVEMAAANAKETLYRQRREDTAEAEWLKAIETLLEVSEPIRRIEVYDNSHIMGRHAVGTMIVAGSQGFDKQSYRIFTVQPGVAVTGGDDYAMLREMLTRRFRRLQHEDAAPRPDLVLIDGGAGQLAVAEQVFADLGLADVPVACIAKGPERNAGREHLFLPGKPPFMLPADDPALHYLQRLRDEAHRFAIMAHRAKRAKAATRSVLDAIPGVGTARKKALLHHFGSLRGVEEASLEELQRVRGINRSTAQKIYGYLRQGR